MNDEHKAKIDQAFKETQAQAQEAASQMGGLMRFGLTKLREAAEKTKEAIQKDIDSRPN